MNKEGNMNRQWGDYLKRIAIEGKKHKDDINYDDFKRAFEIFITNTIKSLLGSFDMSEKDLAQFETLNGFPATIEIFKSGIIDIDVQVQLDCQDLTVNQVKKYIEDPDQTYTDIFDDITFLNKGGTFLETNDKRHTFEELCEEIKRQLKVAKSLR